MFSKFIVNTFLPLIFLEGKKFAAFLLKTNREEPTKFLTILWNLVYDLGPIQRNIWNFFFHTQKMLEN